MRRHRRQFSIWGGVVAVKTVPYIAGAQSYPALPIAIIVPYAAGGPSDVIARMHGQRMRGIIGPLVLKENIVGAGGSISLGRVARAAPDGYIGVLGNWGRGPASWTLTS
jgi:tripartite-type tricarboxylate transporter receptor subunit TctC